MTKSKDMTLERFGRLVTAYGSALDRWPESERAPGRELIETSDEARALVSSEASLDTYFHAYAVPDISPALERRLNEIPARSPRREPWPFGAWWRPVLGWAAAAVVGVVVGATSIGDGLADDDVTALLDGESAELGDDDWVAVAEGSFVDVEVEQ